MQSSDEIQMLPVQTKQSAMNLSPQKRQSKEIKSIFEGLGNNELDWFSFENRIRTLVVLLLDPMQKKIKDEGSKADMIKSEFDIMKRRIEEMDFLIQKTSRSSRDEFLNNYNQLHEDFSERVTSMYSKVTKVDEVRNLYERQIEIYKEDLKRLDLKAETFNREMEKIDFKQRNKIEKVEESMNQKIGDLLKQVTTLKDTQINNEKEMRLTDYYLDKIQPLKSFTQICEVLQDVIVYEREFNKLVAYEQKKYPNLEQDILNSQPIGYLLDKQSYKMPQIPSMKEEKKRYSLQKSIRNNQSQYSLSRSPSNQSALGLTPLFKNNMGSKNHLHQPSTPNTRLRPLTQTPIALLEGQNNTLSASSQGHKLAQFGTFTSQKQGTLQLNQTQIEFLNQLLQSQTQVFFPRDQQSNFQKNHTNQTNRIVNKKRSSMQKGDRTSNSASPKKGQKNNNYPARRDTLKLVKQRSSQIDTNKLLEIADNLKRVENEDLNQRASNRNSFKVKGLREGLISQVKDEFSPQYMNLQRLNSKPTISSIQLQNMDQEDIDKTRNKSSQSSQLIQNLEFMQNDDYSINSQPQIIQLINMAGLSSNNQYLEELKEKASEELESPQLSQRRRRKNLNFNDQERSHSQEFDSSHSGLRDEMILTESELYNKFKEFKVLLFEEEKILFTELCTDIIKSYLSETTEKLEERFKQLPLGLSERVDNIERITQKIEEETFNLIQSYSEDMKKKSKEKRDYQLDFKDVTKGQQHNEIQIKQLNQVIDHVKNRFDKVEEAFNIQLALEMQEENDKNQVGLYGYFGDEQTIQTNNNEGKTQVISLNNNCVSCSGNSSFVIKAFKIACLAYKPNKVKYQNNVYERKELIQRKAQLFNQELTQNHDQTSYLTDQIQIARNQEKLFELLNKNSASKQNNQILTSGRPTSSSTNRLTKPFNQTLSGFNTATQAGRNSSMIKTEKEAMSYVNQSISSVQYGGADISKSISGNQTSDINSHRKNVNYLNNLERGTELSVTGQSSNRPLIQNAQRGSYIFEKTKNLLQLNKDTLMTSKDLNLTQPNMLLTQTQTQKSYIGKTNFKDLQQQTMDQSTQGALNESRQAYTKQFRHESIKELKRLKQSATNRRAQNLSATGMLYSNTSQERAMTSNQAYQTQSSILQNGVILTKLPDRKTSKMNVNIPYQHTQMSSQVNIQDMTQTPNSASSQSIGYLKMRKQTPHRRSKSILSMTSGVLGEQNSNNLQVMNKNMTFTKAAAIVNNQYSLDNTNTLQANKMENILDQFKNNTVANLTQDLASRND
eukprot:403348032